MKHLNPQDFKRSAPSFLPATAVLEMTYLCNHRCEFCSCPWYSEKGFYETRTELTIKEWEKYISDLYKYGICNIAFTGGEPLMKKGIEKVIEHAALGISEHIETFDGKLKSEMKPPKIYLLTNGKLMNENILELCKKHSIHLSMSLPGLASFEEHTKNSDYTNILYWFSRAKEKGVTTTAGITVTQKNISELFETISAALLAGCDTILLNRFMPGGRGLKYKNELTLNFCQIEEMLDIAENILVTAGRYGSVGTELPKCIIKTEKYKHLKVGTRCSAALDFFVVDPSGFIRVCNHSEKRLNHISDIMNLKLNPYWKTFTQKAYLPEECSDCGQNHQCDGGCREAAHIFSGRLNAIDPLFLNYDLKPNLHLRKYR